MSLFTHILIKNSCVHVLMSPLDCCGNTREFASWDVCTISLNNTGGAAGGSGDWVDEELVTDRDDMFAAEQGAGCLSLFLLSARCPLLSSGATSVHQNLVSHSSTTAVDSQLTVQIPTHPGQRASSGQWRLGSQRRRTTVWRRPQLQWGSSGRGGLTRRRLRRWSRCLQSWPDFERQKLGPVDC